MVISREKGMGCNSCIGVPALVSSCVRICGHNCMDMHVLTGVTRRKQQRSSSGTNETEHGERNRNHP